MKDGRVVFTAVGVFIVALLLVGCGGSTTSSTSGEETSAAPVDTRLSDAAQMCGDLDSEGDILSVSNDGTSMFLDGSGEWDLTAFSILGCLEDELGFSEPLKSSIENTSALMGQKEWSESGMTMQWTYHPDNGLDLAITLDAAN